MSAFLRQILMNEDGIEFRQFLGPLIPKSDIYILRAFVHEDHIWCDLEIVSTKTTMLNIRTNRHLSLADLLAMFDRVLEQLDDKQGKH